MIMLLLFVKGCYLTHLTSSIFKKFNIEYHDIRSYVGNYVGTDFGNYIGNCVGNFDRKQRNFLPSVLRYF